MESETRKIFALIGASASGKTTTFETLQGLDLADVAFAQEAARLHYSENDVPKDQRPSYENQSKIQQKFIHVLQTAIAEDKPVVLADCSPLSSIYYAMLGGDADKVEKLTDNIRDLLPLYSLFLLLNPTDVDYQYDPDDSVRRETEEERLRVHDNILHVLQTLSLPFILISGTVEERVEQITKLLR